MEKVRAIHYRVKTKSDHLEHHGIQGQKWGIKNGPPYPLEDNYSKIKSYDKLKTVKINHRLPQMTKDEYKRACELWDRNEELKLPNGLKHKIYEAMDDNLSDDEKEQSVVRQSYNGVNYVAINKGHNTYKIIHKDGPVDLMDDVLTEVVGPDWRKYDD